MLSKDNIREFVIAGHGSFDRVQEMLAQDRALLNATHEWREDDRETALMGAAHVGHRRIAEFLLGQGAQLDICCAAMLGKAKETREFLRKDSAAIRVRGAHSISLLAHAAHSGDVDLVTFLFEQGATDGADQALAHAIGGHHTALALWLLQRARIDKRWKNFQGKTLVDLAVANGMEEVVRCMTE